MARSLLPKLQPPFRHRLSKVLTTLPAPTYASQIAPDSAIELFHGLLINGVYYSPAHSPYEEGLALDNEGSVRRVGSCDGMAEQD